MGTGWTGHVLVWLGRPATVVVLVLQASFGSCSSVGHSAALSRPRPPPAPTPFSTAQEVFLAGALLLQRLVAEPARAQAVTRMPEVLAKYEGVARMLSLRVTQEHKYLAKLEGQKVGGSSGAGGEGLVLAAVAAGSCALAACAA